MRVLCMRKASYEHECLHFKKSERASTVIVPGSFYSSRKEPIFLLWTRDSFNQGGIQVDVSFVTSATANQIKRHYCIRYGNTLGWTASDSRRTPQTNT